MQETKEKMRKAIICIGSPLQAICAIEAIVKYEIDVYDMYVIDEGVRLGQIEEFLKGKNINFTVIPYHVTFWKSIFRIIGAFNVFKGKYDYLLMGDYRLTGNKLECVPLVKSGGTIIYLDDGAYIVSWSKGLIVETKNTRIRNWMIDFICRLRNISHKNLFTIFYSDIVMPGYSIQENCLSQLQMSSTTIGEDIYIIGTNPLGDSGYCKYMGIEYSHYLDIVDNLLFNIRQREPQAHIVYIPHGRDKSEETINICNRLGIEFKRLSVCVELFVLSLDKCPKEIWGYGSTALYTLRKLCKGTKINNIIIEGTNTNSNEEYRELSELYSRNNIENVWVK